MYLCKWSVKRAAAKPHIAQQTMYPRLEKSLAPGHCIVNHCMCILYVYIHRYKRTHNELHYSKTLDDIARARELITRIISGCIRRQYTSAPLSLSLPRKSLFSTRVRLLAQNPAFHLFLPYVDIYISLFGRC